MQPLGRAATFSLSRLNRDTSLDTFGRVVQVLLVFVDKCASGMELLKSAYAHAAPLSRRVVAAKLALVEPNIRSSNHAPVGDCAPPHKCALFLNVRYAREDRKPPPS